LEYSLRQFRGLASPSAACSLERSSRRRFQFWIMAGLPYLTTRALCALRVVAGMAGKEK
jgi:hypothetical protein